MRRLSCQCPASSDLQSSRRPQERKTLMLFVTFVPFLPEYCMTGAAKDGRRCQTHGTDLRTFSWSLLSLSRCCSLPYMFNVPYWRWILSIGVRNSLEIRGCSSWRWLRAHRRQGKQDRNPWDWHIWIPTAHAPHAAMRSLLWLAIPSPRTELWWWWVVNLVNWEQNHCFSCCVDSWLVRDCNMVCNML
jgi:hypothetical protein